jgi:hypothetical protein
MDTQTLIEALRALQPEELEWKFALYSAHKSKDGTELDWYLAKMKGASAWADTIKTTLLEKTTAEKTVAEYSPFLSDKEHIAALAKTDDMIKDQISDILLNIKNGLAYAPEDFVSGTLPKVTGYAFYGERKDEEGTVIEQALFMRRGNPFLSGQKVRLCTSSGDEIVTAERPILKFTPATDFILIGDACYFNSASIEKDFDLENRHFAIAAKRMTLIADARIVSDYEKLEEVVMSAKNARKFLDFDKKILEHIVRLSIVERGEFLSLYDITVDNNGCMNTYDTEQCDLIIDLLCCRSVIDPLGRVMVANNVMPRE